jgi:flagellar protein FliO/FliZ
MPGIGAAGASYGDMLVTSLVVLGAVCVAAFIVVRLVGRLLATGRSRGAHLLDVVARLPLEPRRSLYVVEVAGKTLLVGTSEMGLSVLSELDGDEVRSRALERPSFGELVRQAWLRRAAIRSRQPPAHPPSGQPTAPEPQALPNIASSPVDDGSTRAVERLREPRSAATAAGDCDDVTR